MFVFQFPTPEFKNDYMKHNNTVNSTNQIGRHWLRPEVFGLCLEIEAYPMTKTILKKHFIPETFISIDNNLQRRVRLHNTTQRFYMPNIISEEILVFYHVIPMSVLSIFIATAYDILRFTAKIEIKV